jgi:hypothetical protein
MEVHEFCYESTPAPVDDTLASGYGERMTLLAHALLLATLAPPHPAIDVRFEYEDGRVYVPVSAVVHGKKVALGWFILDTGAGGVVFDTRVAERLGLEVRSAGSQTGAGSGASKVGRAKGVPLGVDGVPLSPDSVLVAPLDAQLAPSCGRTVAGIVGSQFFDEHAVEFDRGRNLLRVDPPGVAGGADLPAHGRCAIPFELADELPMIRASLAIPGAASAATTLKLIVDLGAKAPLLLTGPLLERIGGEARLGRRALASLGAGVGGETRYWFTRVGALRAGAGAAPLADSLVAGFSAFNTLRSSDYDGLIGAPLLDHFAVLFDYSRKLLWLAPRADGAAAPEPLTAFDRAGIFVLARDSSGVQHLDIRRVVAESPAAEAGIEEGDELTSVDGQDARGLRLSAVRRRLRAGATTSVSLGILHDGHADVRVLSLRDLL